MKTDNELIAEFMGSTYIKDGTMRYWIIDGRNHSTLHYETSWDWLMPVVEKIKLSYDVSIRFYSGDCTCYINKQTLEGIEISSFGNFEPSIMNVYKAVVKFIKWYNSQKL